MLRILAMAGGLAGALACSQVPEFSQQYLQRLAGQVDALTVVALDFDRSALASGLGREEALQQMTGTEFLTARQGDMRGTFARHAALSEHLAVLRDASPLARLTMPHRLADGATLTATWADFAPAVPTSLAGLIAAATGFAGGWLGALAVLALLYWPFSKAAQWLTRPRQFSGGDRRDPPVLRPPRPTLVDPEHPYVPRLIGGVR